MKPHGVIIKPSRKRVRPRHSGPAFIKPRTVPNLTPTSSTAVVGTRELQLARALSDTEAEARDAALLSLHAWLGEHGANLSDADMDKLCKAIFYCLWMADKKPVIALVVERVVGLSEVGRWPYLAALLRCVVREWHGIDRHRVDKYYELITVAVEACVQRCLREGGDEGAQLVASVKRAVGVLEAEIVAKAGMGASGVALHVLDYWGERVVEPVVTRARELLPLNDVVNVFECVMSPVYVVLAPKFGTLMAVALRAVERVCEPMPALLGRIGVSDKAQRDMCRRVMKKVWAAAATKETLEGCRGPLYAVHATLKAHAVELEAKGGVLPTRSAAKRVAGGGKASVGDPDAPTAMEAAGPAVEAAAKTAKAPVKAPAKTPGKAPGKAPGKRRVTRRSMANMEVDGIVADADPFA
jgi:Nucleolar protein,Nop52